MHDSKYSQAHCELLLNFTDGLMSTEEEGGTHKEVESPPALVRTSLVPRMLVVMRRLYLHKQCSNTALRVHA